MIRYKTELAINKSADEVLSLLRRHYYDGQPVFKDGAVLGYNYRCKTLLFAIDTAICVYTISGETFISMSSTAREHRRISGSLLYLLKPFLYMRQLHDLRYLKKRIEE